MVYYAVTGCKSNRVKKSRNYLPDYRDFSFITARETRKLYLQQCSQKHDVNTGNERIFSQHFPDDDIHIREKLQQLHKNRWKLKDYVLPPSTLSG